MTDFLRAELVEQAHDGRIVFIDPFTVVAIRDVFKLDQRGPIPQIDERRCELVTDHGTYTVKGSSGEISQIVMQGTTQMKEAKDDG